MSEPARMRQHQWVATDPPRDGLQLTQARHIDLDRPDEWLDIVAADEPKGFSGRNYRRDLPKCHCERLNPAIGDEAHDDVDHQRRDKRRNDLWR